MVRNRYDAYCWCEGGSGRHDLREQDRGLDSPGDAGSDAFKMLAVHLSEAGVEGFLEGNGEEARRKSVAALRLDREGFAARLT